MTFQTFVSWASLNKTFTFRRNWRKCQSKRTKDANHTILYCKSPKKFLTWEAVDWAQKRFYFDGNFPKVVQVNCKLTEPPISRWLGLPVSNCHCPRPVSWIFPLCFRVIMQNSQLKIVCEWVAAWLLRLCIFRKTRFSDNEDCVDFRGGLNATQRMMLELEPRTAQEARNEYVTQEPAH